LFGGAGYDSTGTFAYLNDLWEFNISSGEWTWVGGSSTGSTSGYLGVYGVKGTAATGNFPGGRDGGLTWTDSQGNLWLFGGDGYASSGSGITFLNDLWEFNPAKNEWTWISGSSSLVGGYIGQPGVYGTLGTAAEGNVPGGRAGAVGWIDSNNNLWLFGGSGFDVLDGLGDLNDLWELNTTTGQWTWKGGTTELGSYNLVSLQTGVYETWMTPNAANLPGGRQNGVSWTDKSGNFWLFAGYGFNYDGYDSNPNDLWELSPSNAEWVWMGGSQQGGPGVYGTLYKPAFGNIPGNRSGAVSWTDTSGRFWLFGGSGDDANGKTGF
jgi:hypothetical protein